MFTSPAELVVSLEAMKSYLVWVEVPSSVNRNNPALVHLRSLLRVILYDLRVSAGKDLELI